MGCCSKGRGRGGGNRTSRNVVSSGVCRSPQSKLPRSGKRKVRKAQGHAR